MSPDGNKLQNYFRKYPSLVNCTTIDWFLNWPTEALLAVSDHFLLKQHSLIYEATMTISEDDGKQEKGTERAPNEKKRKKGLEPIAENEERDDASNNDPAGSAMKAREAGSAAEREEARSQASKDYGNPEAFTPTDIESDPKVFAMHADLEEDPELIAIAAMPVRDRVSNVVTQIHQSAMNLAHRYEQEKRRHVYVTPVLFTGMFALFERLLTRKNRELESERSKYEQGVKKLEEAKVMIDYMQEQLENLKPILEEKSKQVEKTMKRLEKESKEVQSIKEVVDAEAAQVQAQVNIAQEMKADCQARLAVAEPYFDRAIKALRTLSQSDFVLMKSFTHPPPGVRLALEACCVMLGIQPKWVKKDGAKVADYWDKSKKLINNYKKLID
jgi:hypothetical protein